MQHLDEGTLQAWLDRDRSGLDAAAREKIEGHLATCGECRARLQNLEEVDERAASILSSTEPVDQSIPDFEEVVERSRRSRPGGGKPRRSPWLTTAWAASLVGAIAAGWMTNELYDGEAPPGAPSAVPDEMRPPAAVEVEARPGGSDPTASEPRAAEDPEAPRRGEEESSLVDPDASAAGPTRAAGDRGVALDAEVPPVTFDAPSPSPDAAQRMAEPRAVGSVEAEESPESAEDGEAGEPVVLTGRVTDESGRPVPSAQVFVPGSRAGTLTDRDGSFTLTLPRELEADDGGLEVAVERIGFARATVPVGGDSLADVAGATDAVTADIRLREEALALDEVVVAGETAGWESVDRARAEEMAGFSIHSVPELEILGIEIRELDGTAVVRVRQAVGPGAVLTLTESGDPGSGPGAGFASLPSDSTMTTVTTRRGEVWITGTAPVAADSLRALVERVR